MMIAVLALMIAGIYALMGSRSGRSHGSFTHPGDGRCIITAGCNGRVSNRVEGGDQTNLREQGGMLQITVSNGTFRAGGRHHTLLHLFRKGQAPNVWLACSIKVDAPHTGLSGIGSA